jgi:ribosomal protein L11 methyltransferase
MFFFLLFVLQECRKGLVNELDWLKITCAIPDRKGLEAVDNIFNEYFENGIQVDDPGAILNHVESNDWDAHEFSEDILAHDTLKVIGYLAKDASAKDRYDSLREEVRQALAVFGQEAVWNAETLADQDWSETWKENYHVMHFGSRIQVVPVWLQPDVPEDVVIYMDPGMAFGTGDHETTALCLEWLDDLVTKDCSVFDVGTGSGILAIAASKLGAGRVDAMDFDDVAVYAAAQNGARNNAQIMVYKSDLLKRTNGKADLIIANIVADVIIKLLDEVPSHLAKDGKFLCSGILDEYEPKVSAALQDAGFRIIEKRQRGAWFAILADRPEE